jgi:Domain of unknown function (DUF6316)
MMRRREDHEEKTYFRSDRLFSMNGQWYFGTREGDCGPYASREAAKVALSRFINEKIELDAFQKSRERDPHKSKVSLAERLRRSELSLGRPIDTAELLI